MSSKFLALGLALWSAVGAAQNAQTAAGHWEGKLETPGPVLTIAVDLAQNAAGLWIGSMSVSQSTAVDVPLSGIIIEPSGVRFEASLPYRASFAGSFSADRNQISGSASNVQGSIPFELTRKGAANVKTPAPSSAMTKEFEGAWEGTMEVGGKPTRVGLKMLRSPDGVAAGALITERNGGEFEIPVTTVAIKGTELQLEARAVSGTYRGTLGGNGEIAGEWSQGSNRLPLTFKRKP